MGYYANIRNHNYAGYLEIWKQLHEVMITGQNRTLNNIHIKMIYEINQDYITFRRDRAYTRCFKGLNFSGDFKVVLRGFVQLLFSCSQQKNKEEEEKKDKEEKKRRGSRKKGRRQKQKQKGQKRKRKMISLQSPSVLSIPDKTLYELHKDNVILVQ